MNINIKSVDIKAVDGFAICLMIVELKNSSELNNLKSQINEFETNLDRKKINTITDLQTKIIVKERQALPVIDLFTPEENAAYAVNYMTAWVSLFEMARLRSTDSVLIQAAAGGVGTAAVQLAKHFGCTVFGTAGSDEKIKLLSDLNIDGAINYQTQDFENEIKKMTNGKGVDVILEVVGGEVYKKSLRLLSPLGRIIVVGFASMNMQKWNPLSWLRTWRDMPKATIMKMAEKSYGVMATHLGYLLPNEKQLQHTWNELCTFMDTHDIKPVVGHTFDFDEIEKAHSDVFNILLQILDDGRLTDGHGRTVDFTNTIIIMTSNLITADNMTNNFGFLQDLSDQEAVKQRSSIDKVLKKSFRPEFINRIDEIIVFEKLTKDELKQISDLIIKDIQKRLDEKGIEIHLSGSAKELLISEGYDEEFGARPLKRLIQRKIENEISTMIISGKVSDGIKINITSSNGNLTFKTANSKSKSKTLSA